jgi:hypothetical protein
MPLPEEIDEVDQSMDLPVDEEIPAPLSYAQRDRNSEVGQKSQLCRRERRTPKFFMYDKLGTPTYYNAGPTNNVLEQYQPVHYANSCSTIPLPAVYL